RSRSRLDRSRDALRRADAVARVAVLLGDGGQAVEGEEDDAAAHAGPGGHALSAESEERPTPGLLPEIVRVAPLVGARAGHVAGAKRALTLEGLDHRGRSRATRISQPTRRVLGLGGLLPDHARDFGGLLAGSRRDLGIGALGRDLLKRRQGARVVALVVEG